MTYYGNHADPAIPLPRRQAGQGRTPETVKAAAEEVAEAEKVEGEAHHRTVESRARDYYQALNSANSLRGDYRTHRYRSRTENWDRRGGEYDRRSSVLEMIRGRGSVSASARSRHRTSASCGSCHLRSTDDEGEEGKRTDSAAEVVSGRYSGDLRRRRSGRDRDLGAGRRSEGWDRMRKCWRRWNGSEVSDPIVDCNPFV